MDDLCGTAVLRHMAIVTRARYDDVVATVITAAPIIRACVTGMVIRIERRIQAARLRGPSNMMVAPTRQTAAPMMSHRSGRVPSTAHSQHSDAQI